MRKMSRQEGCSQAAKEIFTFLTKSQAGVASRFVKHARILRPKKKKKNPLLDSKRPAST